MSIKAMPRCHPERTREGSCLGIPSQILRGVPLRMTVVVVLFVSCTSSLAGNKVTINEDKVLLINGKKVFPIGFTMAPPPGSKAPNGRDGLQELHDAGGSFLRSGPNASAR